MANKMKFLQSKKLFLAQTDTTAGFLSASKERICEAKNRPLNQGMLIEASALAQVKRISRIPRILGRKMRCAKKTTFIFPNNHSFRVVGDFAPYRAHHRFLSNVGALYSSSANEGGKKFDYDFAESCAEVVVLDRREICECAPSQIFRVRKNKIRKFR